MRQVVVFAMLCLPLCAAGPEYERALELYSHTDYQGSLNLLVPAQEKTAAQHVLIGQNYFMLGDAKRAAESFQRAVALEPGNSVYYHWLGRAYGRRAETGNPFAALGYASKARQNFEKAVELDPNNSEAVNDLFEFYLEAPGFIGGGMDKAVKMADRIAEMNAAEGDYARARIEEKRKDYPGAEQHLRRAMELAPRQVGRVIDLAKFLAKRGRFDESEQAFVAAEKLDPHAPKVLYARAATYIETGRNLETARELLEKYLAASLTPDDPSREEAEKLLRQASGG
ncbi:MAG TPA: tetratricopeptide repeat protein [Bryobacteraceae bacterium]|nr:tetratricopeptide repeat protein [Bryobacteraceae bacterium]